MQIEIEFKTKEDEQRILEENKEKFLLCIKYKTYGNFLVFSDEEPIYMPTLEEQYNILLQEHGNKISILTEENEKLKQELALTQDAVNEILFMMMNMEGK